MQKNNVFLSSKNKRLIMVGLLLTVLLLISGCSTATGTIDSGTPGFFNHFVIYPLSAALQFLADSFHGSYGLAIIGITLIIRLLLMPLMLKQYRSQQQMKHKMSALQPELKQLQAKYKGKSDADSKQKLQQETMLLYQKHQVNPLAMGCLPLLIQMPILMGLYSAIKLTPELADHSFLWFKLGSPDIVLPIVAGIVYFIQFKFSQTTQPGADPAQQKQLAFMGYLSPILMGVFALSAPAAISLYWVTGGLFMIAQSYLAKKVYVPRADVAPKGNVS
ncbi:membrane protein insertase YidC [Paenibacillus sp. sgz302251]|uniref:membrane protein insertase YidC n=1 Tax=Paenibacillus sp. sgz302251 TaxID=3414493 RepID=UPI003C7CCC24